MEINEFKNQAHLSASGINDYLECGLLYKFSRIEKRQPEIYSDSLVLGKAIHRVLADFYLKLRAGTRLAQKNLEEAFDHHWEELAHGRGDITYKPGKSLPYPSAPRAKSLLAAFNRDLPDEDCNILGVEQPFICEIEGLPVPLIGIYDLVLEDPAGTITIVDHKTASKSYTMADANQNLQMTIYHMAARANGYGERDILLRLDCLIKPRSQNSSSTTPLGVIGRRRRPPLKSGPSGKPSKKVFIPNDGGWKCGNCGYKTACKEWFLAGHPA